VLGFWGCSFAVQIQATTPANQSYDCSKLCFTFSPDNTKFTHNAPAVSPHTNPRVDASSNTPGRNARGGE
jgi:hypothetical protein